MPANSWTASPAPADVTDVAMAVVGSWPRIPPAVRPRRGLAVLAGVVAAWMTVSCTSWSLGSTTDLAAALAAPPEGFGSNPAAEVPSALCSTGNGNPGGIVPPELGSPPGELARVGYRSADSVLDIYAWQTPSPVLAQAYVEGLTNRGSDCDYELYYDSDTDGDGNLDSGGHDVQQALDWSDSGWAGVAISAESSGGSSQVGETRLVWRGAVILLASLTVDGGSDSAAAAATLDTFLRSVAGRLD